MGGIEPRVLLDSVQSQANRMEQCTAQSLGAEEDHPAGHHGGFHRLRPAKTAPGDKP